MTAVLVILLLSQARLSQHPGGCLGRRTFNPRSLPRLQDDWKMPMVFFWFLGFFLFVLGVFCFCFFVVVFFLPQSDKEQLTT